MNYIFDVAYGVGKAAMDRMANDMAIEIATENITMVEVRVFPYGDIFSWGREVGGIPWYTMVYHGIPCYTMVYHGIPCVV